MDHRNRKKKKKKRTHYPKSPVSGKYIYVREILFLKLISMKAPCYDLNSQEI